MEAVEEVKELLIDNSRVTEWDDRSILEFILHFYDWNDDLTDETIFDVNIFANDMEFLMWYFEDDTTQFLINQIIECENVTELTQSCMNDGVTKLSNGAIVRCLI